jgi:hypothetical protein
LALLELKLGLGLALIELGLELPLVQPFSVLAFESV